MERLKNLLKKSGFSEKEIEVYLALIEKGTSVASDIAQQADINRSTTYVILDSLLKRGLVTETERRGVKLFSSNEPEKLMKYFEQASRRYAEFAEEARTLIPAITAKMQSRAQQENIATHPENVYEHALDSLETIRAQVQQTGTTDKIKNPNHNRNKLHPEVAKGSI